MSEQLRNDGTAWWGRHVTILAHLYLGDTPTEADARTIGELVKWKRSMGFDAEHLIVNLSMEQGAEGGDDSRAYRFKNRWGCIDDYLGVYLPIAHEHGLRVIVYFNCHWFRSTAFGEDHFVLDPAGKAVIFYGSGLGVCPRGPFREWSRRMAEDLGSYPIDGVFLDGPSQHRCFCAACRAEFRACHGRQMPAS
ncbi:MAG TPA: hypothetical protein VM243_18345, partial [Phycisphaerae bacterium]|nr:hypothetical protein [Phycisphaerae bacterium]